MPQRLGKLLIGYGAFLIAAGVAGYLSNPEKAGTALISGGISGSLSILWGVLLQTGKAWAGTVGLVMSGLLAGVFTWRAISSWRAYAGGETGKLVAASIITAMLVASVVTFVVLWRARRGGQAGGVSAD